MEKAKRKKPEINDGEETPSKISLSPFHFTDLTMQVGTEKLYVNKDQLMVESPVFRTMLTGNFMEKDAHEIKLPDKDPTTFALFLKHTLAGFDELVLSEATARRILPLTHEYQTNVSLIKIDKKLAFYTNEREYKSVDKLIDDILEAEFYTLPTYLTACISKACAFSPTAFEKNLHFVDISSETKAKIFIMKCKIMESKIGSCMKVLGQYVSGFSSPADICYIVTNAKQMLNSLLLNAIENR